MSFFSRLNSLLVAAALVPGMLLFAPPSSAKGSGARSKAVQPSVQARRVSFEMQGASCLACLRRIERLLRRSEGVLSVEVEEKHPSPVVIVFDSRKTSWKKLEELIRKEGGRVNNLSEGPLLENKSATR